jgi:DNA-binding GntR family transcriptional regulator
MPTSRAVRVRGDGFLRNVEMAYEALKRMIVTCEIRPGQRLNISELADRVGASRTPVREALHRLASEGLCDGRADQGFIAGSFQPQRIFDLYELRRVVECGAVRLAAERAEMSQLESLVVVATERSLSPVDDDNTRLVNADEFFHDRIAEISGNVQILRTVRNLNDQIRFLRGIDRASRGRLGADDHLRIATALQQRDADAAEQIMATHITRRMDEIIGMIRQSVVRLYGPAEALTG